MSKKNKQRINRVVACMIAGTLAMGTLLTQSFAVTNWYRHPEGSTWALLAKESWGSKVLDKANEAKLVATGLTYEFGSPTFSGDVKTGWAKKWLNNEGKAKTADVRLASREETVSINFTKFTNTYLTCMDGHVPALSAPGSQAFAQYVYYPTDNMEDYPDFIQNACGGDIQKAKFQLLLCSYTIAEAGKLPIAALKDDTEKTEFSIVSFMTFRAQDEGAAYGRASQGNTWQEDWANITKAGTYGFYQGFEQEYNPDKFGSTAVWDAVCIGYG